MSTNEGIQGSGSSVTLGRKTPIELCFDRSTTTLRITCSPGSHAYASVSDRQHSQLAFSSAHFSARLSTAERDRFVLNREHETPHNKPTLWLGGAAFELSTQEADRVEQTFAECGLEVERSEAA